MNKYIILLLFTFLLTSCGGGGSSRTDLVPERPIPPQNGSVRATELQLHRSAQLVEFNLNPSEFMDSQWWHANPQIDLPSHGRDGLRVERPSIGGAIVPFVQLSPRLQDSLEPGWRFDSNARGRLRFTGWLLWKLSNWAYTQWTRHLDYDPNILALQVGAQGSLNCHGGRARACYNPAVNAVILSDSWIIQNYSKLFISAILGDEEGLGEVAQELLWVMTHEAGHQFGYRNPAGITEGCGTPSDRCHAPDGSGSVISYDPLKGRSARYYVTREDIRHIPNATWNGNEVDRYTVSMSGVPDSIDSWGIWIDHRFNVEGQTAPGQTFGGNFDLVDEIIGTGWVRGKPSMDVSLTGTATWSGKDNFLGIDLDPSYLGALLRADANLRFTFRDRASLNLRVNNFEAHYAGLNGIATWHNHNLSDRGDFSYNMDCTSGGCSGTGAEAKWYASDTGDPSGWVGGVVSDRNNNYTGSFVAEKD